MTTTQAAAGLDAEVHRINLSWLARLRWGAIAGQALAIGIVHFGLAIALPMAWLLAILAVEALCNLGCLRFLRGRAQVGEGTVAAMLAFDVFVLTALLYLTGGPFNPFSFLYLVHVALAAVVLRSFWTWTLVAFSLLGFAFLFVEHRPLDASWFAHGHDMHAGHDMHTGHDMHAGHDMRASGAQHDPAMSMHLQGMWLGVAVAAVFIVYFVSRITRDLALREAELLATRARAARSEKLAALATLAAGAAHELASPLSTIAVAAKELERGSSGEPALAAVRDDVRLIRNEVDRCRGILQQMSVDAGQSVGEAPVTTTPERVVELALAPLENRARIEQRGEPAALHRTLLVPERALSGALRGIVRNALLASPPGGEVVVEVRAEASGRGTVVEVRDQGAGMAEEVLSRVGEPFFTTREPGQGMGLGVFVARALLEQLGGKLEIRSAPLQGTQVALHLPERPEAPS